MKILINLLVQQHPWKNGGDGDGGGGGGGSGGRSWNLEDLFLLYVFLILVGGDVLYLPFGTCIRVSEREQPQIYFSKTTRLI